MRTSTSAWAAALAIMSMRGPFTTAEAAPARQYEDRGRHYFPKHMRRGYNASEPAFESSSSIPLDESSSSQPPIIPDIPQPSPQSSPTYNEEALVESLIEAGQLPETANTVVTTTLTTAFDAQRTATYTLTYTETSSPAPEVASSPALLTSSSVPAEPAPHAHKKPKHEHEHDHEKPTISTRGTGQPNLLGSIMPSLPLPMNGGSSHRNTSQYAPPASSSAPASSSVPASSSSSAPASSSDSPGLLGGLNSILGQGTKPDETPDSSEAAPTSSQAPEEKPTKSKGLLGNLLPTESSDPLPVPKVHGTNGLLKGTNGLLPFNDPAPTPASKSVDAPSQASSAPTSDGGILLGLSSAIPNVLGTDKQSPDAKATKTEKNGLLNGLGISGLPTGLPAQSVLPTGALNGGNDNPSSSGAADGLGLTDGLTNLVGTATGLVGTITDGVNSLVSQATPAVDTLTDGVNSVVSPVVTGATGLVGTVTDGVNSVVSPVVTGLSGAVETVTDGVNSAVSPVVTGVTGAVGTVTDGVDSALSPVVTGVTGAVGTITDGVNSVVSPVVTGLSGAVETVTDGVNSVVSPVVTGVTGAVGTVTDGVDSALSPVVTGVTGAVGTVTDGVNSVVSPIVTGVTGAVGTVTDGVDSLVSHATGVVGTVTDGANSIISPVVTGVTGAVGTATDDLTSVVNTLTGGLTAPTGGYTITGGGVTLTVPIPTSIATSIPITIPTGTSTKSPLITVPTGASSILSSLSSAAPTETPDTATSNAGITYSASIPLTGSTKLPLPLPTGTASSSHTTSSNDSSAVPAPAEPSSSLAPETSTAHHATHTAAPETIKPTGTDSLTSMTFPTSWKFAPTTWSTKTSGLSTATEGSDTTAVTGLPTYMPQLVQPPGGMPGPPANSTLIQLGFNYGLNYPFVVGEPDSASQIFAYLPQGIAYGLGISQELVKMNALMPYDTAGSLKYITTLAQAYIPSQLVDTMEMSIHMPLSEIYANPDAPVKTLMSMINPTIPILPGADLGGDTSSSAWNPAATSNNGPGAGAPIGGDSGSSNHVKPSTLGIGLGAVGGAAVYAAAMVYVARRYKQKRQGHQRASSVHTTGEMSQRSGGMAGFFMSGANGRHSGNESGARGSRTSGGSSNGRSVREQGISAPVMAENSLGWN